MVQDEGTGCGGLFLEVGGSAVPAITNGCIGEVGSSTIFKDDTCPPTGCRGGGITVAVGISPGVIIAVIREENGIVACARG